MMKIKLVIIAALFFHNVLAQQNNNNSVYFENKQHRTKQSSSLLVDIAQELIHRSSSSSQILNFNLSNLLLLLILKVVVYGAGYIGNHTFKGRGNFADDNILSEGEAILALGYLIGDTCLYRAACEVPHTAKQYFGAADMIFHSMRLMPQISILISDSYEKIMMEFQKAINLGLESQCPSDYNCKKENIHRFLRQQ